MEDHQGRGCCKVDASYAHAQDMCIVYLKDPEFPDEEVVWPTPTTRYAVRHGNNILSEFGADDFEDGVLESMMPPFMFYQALRKRENEGRRSSKRKRNPLLLRQLTYYPPPAHAQIVDALERLTCGQELRKLHASYRDAAFVDLTAFEDVDKAINRGKDCLRWIQERMGDEPWKWGQSSSNLGCL